MAVHVRVCAHFSQFLNGAVAPLAVASPSYLSLVWFPDSQRNTATALANTRWVRLPRGVLSKGPAMLLACAERVCGLVLECWSAHATHHAPCRAELVGVGLCVWRSTHISPHCAGS